MCVWEYWNIRLNSQQMPMLYYQGYSMPSLSSETPLLIFSTRFFNILFSICVEIIVKMPSTVSPVEALHNSKVFPASITERWAAPLSLAVTFIEKILKSKSFFFFFNTKTVVPFISSCFCALVLNCTLGEKLECWGNKWNDTGVMKKCSLFVRQTHVVWWKLG